MKSLLRYYMFVDSYSGGFRKHPAYDVIILQARSHKDACDAVELLTGWYPHDKACHCGTCLENYITLSNSSLEYLTQIERYQSESLEKFLEDEEVLLLET